MRIELIKKNSLDTSDFDVSFLRGLSLEDGTATITDFTASVIGESISLILNKDVKVDNILVCGGGRKNKILLKKFREKINSNININLIDNYGVNGDFIESQAFAFLAIRSFKGLPISFPNTTNCIKPCLGGEIVQN